MIKSLYNGVTGLKTHNQRMDVIGNNIANVNTTGFKAGTVTFKDVYYQTRKNASGGSFTQGGINPTQVGYGVQLGTISKVMSQSGFTYSDNGLDMALTGSGFFQVMDSQGNIFYTRLGRFELDDYGNLTDANGNVVLGVSGDPTNVPASSQRINLRIPAIEDSSAWSSKAYEGHNIVIRAGGDGPGGNIAITIRDIKRTATETEAPYATMSGSTLIAAMDLSLDYRQLAIDGKPGSLIGSVGIGTAPAFANPAAPTAAELRAYAAWEQSILTRISDLFGEDLNDAIRLGGVNLDPAVQPLEIEFVTVPDVTEAISASNYLTIKKDIADPDNNTLYFEMNQPGSAGNSKSISIATNASLTPGTVQAQWQSNNSVLVITVAPDTALDLAVLQDKIDQAAIGRESLMITVTGGVEDPLNPGTFTIDFSEMGNTKQTINMSGGKNTFFNEALSSLQTMVLSGGAYYTEQNVSDTRLFVDEDGIIYAEHLGELLLIGRIDIVDFINPEGLQQVGTSYFIETLASGPAQVKRPRDDTSTCVASGALEMSNVDLSNEFSDMIITQRGFQANSRVITVSDSMLEELVNLKR